MVSGHQVTIDLEGVTYILLARVFKYVDNLILLGSNGRIVEQGPPHKVHVSEEILQHGASDHGAGASTEAIGTVEATKAASSVDEANEEVNRRTGDLSVYGYYFRSIGWPKSLATLALYLAYVFLFKFPQVWLQMWTDAASIPGGANDAYYLGVYGALTVLSVGVVFGTIWFWFVVVVPSSAQNLHRKLLDVVMHAPLSFFTSTDNGVTLNRFSQDMTLVDQSLPAAMFGAMFFFLCSIMEAALICLGAGLVAVAIPPVILVLYFLQKYYLRTSRQVRLLDLEAKSPLYSHFTETLSGIQTIRALGWKDASLQLHLKRLDISQNPYYLLFCVQRWLMLVLDFVVAGLAILLVTVATQDRLATNGGAIGVALVNVLGFNSRLAFLIVTWTNLETSLGAISRLINFEKSTAREDQPGEDQSAPRKWPKGSIELDRVTVSVKYIYEERETSSFLPVNSTDDPPILHDLTLKVSGGQKVGICGRSGRQVHSVVQNTECILTRDSGKSSMLLALLHLLDSSSGTIHIDNIDISHIPRDDLRSNIITLPQDPVFLPGTVRSNLDTRSCVSDSAIETALQRVGLYDLVMEMGGLKMEMQNLSENLSQGQKQVFCLSRALVEKDRSGLFIVDEGTSR